MIGQRQSTNSTILVICIEQQSTPTTRPSLLTRLQSLIERPAPPKPPMERHTYHRTSNTDHNNPQYYAQQFNNEASLSLLGGKKIGQPFANIFAVLRDPNTESTIQHTNQCIRLYKCYPNEWSYDAEGNIIFSFHQAEQFPHVIDASNIKLFAHSGDFTHPPKPPAPLSTYHAIMKYVRPQKYRQAQETYTAQRASAMKCAQDRYRLFGTLYRHFNNNQFVLLPVEFQQEILTCQEWKTIGA